VRDEDGSVSGSDDARRRPQAERWFHVSLFRTSREEHLIGLHVQDSC